MDRWRLEGMLAGAPRPVELDIIRFASDGILMLPVRSSFLPRGQQGPGGCRCPGGPVAGGPALARSGPEARVPAAAAVALMETPRPVHPHAAAHDLALA